MCVCSGMQMSRNHVGMPLCVLRVCVMCIYVDVCVCAGMWVCVYEDDDVRLCIYVFVCLCVFVYVYSYECLYYVCVCCYV